MKKNAKKVAEKAALFNQMFDAVYAYKFGDGTYEDAKSAASAYAEHSNISYQRACDVVMELFR